MRIWQDAQGNLITDEQLLRYIAASGSLSHALEEGDVCLIVPTDEALKPAEEHRQEGRRRSHAALSSFL